MLKGRCQVTVLDWNGKMHVSNVEKDDLWLFPSGLPHSLQGLEDGCEFLIVFDDGTSSEYNTLLLTEWMAHIPFYLNNLMCQNLYLGTYPSRVNGSFKALNLLEMSVKMIIHLSFG
jgi:oxalate decarboxylase/phosphoglucose isomerase-like protein (cupin superfamily)